MHGQVVTHHLVLPPFPAGRAAHIYRFLRHSGPGLLTVSTAPKFLRPLSFHTAPPAYTIFIKFGAPQDHIGLLKKSPKALYRQVGDLPHNCRPLTYMP
jgi:hypothetical protein